MEQKTAIPLEWMGISQVFASLGDPERQRIVLAFGGGDAEMTATAIADSSALARPTVSHHLGLLHRSGCLNRRKKGREVFYSLNRTMLKEVFSRCQAYLALGDDAPA